ncbi:MAG: hypothetical protein HOV81_31995 [Kofleriaceae bacterium]|nr:hypothetical protein [Kofleriaceae bacterium]
MTVARGVVMRMYRRAERIQIRDGNVLPDVAGEICTRPAVLAAGTGAHEIVEDPDWDRDVTAVRVVARRH